MTSEFQLIARFLAPFPRSGPGIRLGPGDDCAVLRASPGRELCVTTDALVEGVHFDFATFSDAEIGHKALAVNLSDLAAMGARPTWFLCSIALPPEQEPRVMGIARGMARLAEKAGLVLAGGNFTRARELSLHLTVAGEVATGKALTRAGAKPGDALYVTGNLGDASLALAQSCVTSSLGLRQRRPEPRLSAGSAAVGLVHAALDLSDGLVQDGGHMAEASGVKLVFDAERLPVSRSVRNASDGLVHALTGGEDYELLFAVGPKEGTRFEAAMKRAETPVTAIGRVEKGSGVEVLGGPPLLRPGHDHFG